MSRFSRSEIELQQAFLLEATQRVEETRVMWTAFAESRRLRMVTTESGLPAFEGSVEGSVIGVAAVGNAGVGFHTRAFTEAKIALRGKLKVAPPGDWDELLSQLRKRHSFEDPDLDRLLVVKTSDDALAQTVLDERVVKTLRALAPARCELSYEDGAITLLWAGVERQKAVLDDVLDVLAYLAVRGSESTPYR